MIRMTKVVRYGLVNGSIIFIYPIIDTLACGMVNMPYSYAKHALNYLWATALFGRAIYD